MADKDRLEHVPLGNDAGPPLHHDDPRFGPRDDDVDVAALPVLDGGVDFELAVQPADAHGGDGAGEGHIGEVQRGGSPDHGEDVGIVFLVHREHGGDHLRLAAVLFGKERPERPVDQARGQGFLFAGAADFAPEIVARDAARRVDLFLVFDLQRNEVRHPLFARGDDRHQHHRVPVAYDRGAGGLLGDLSRLDAPGLASDVFFQQDFHQFLLGMRGREGPNGSPFRPPADGALAEGSGERSPPSSRKPYFFSPKESRMAR